MKVKFLPKKDINVEICDIYEDREAVIIQNSDTFINNTAYNVEALGFKYGIKPTCFIWPYSGVQNGLKEVKESGVINFGIYYATDRYRDSNGSFVLPDYLSNIISQSGVDYYGRELGEAKQVGFPNQGQELFDYSYGSKGYDIINSAAGENGNVGFINEIEFNQEWFKRIFGIYSSGLSDRQGKIGSKEIYMPYSLGVRWAVYDDSVENIKYTDISRLDFIHKKITSKWETALYKEDTIIEDDIVISCINKSFDNKGVFNDFTHWHLANSQGKIDKLEYLYNLINTSVNNRNAWFCGYNNMIEYYWYKTMVKRVRGTFINSKLYLIADFDDDFFSEKIAGIDKKLLYSMIKQPLSVKIDLSGTAFENQDIQGSDIIKLGNNNFIVDIPFNVVGNKLQQISLSITNSPKYKNFNKPNVLSFNNGILNVDIPCKAVLFNGEFNENITVLKRFNEYKTQHDFLGVSGSKIGLITEYGVSILYDL